MGLFLEKIPSGLRKPEIPKKIMPVRQSNQIV
jgi:hypothetical protein